MKALKRRHTDRIVGPLSPLATLEPLTVQVAFAIIIVTIGGNAPLQLAVAAVGSGLLSELFKRTFARPRPAGAHVIRWIRGFSYPSGDLLTAPAIYLTIALIVSPHLPDGAARAVLYMIITTLLSLLAACRVYVGVHYPSDVTAGVLLGAAWALFTSAWFVSRARGKLCDRRRLESRSLSYSAKNRSNTNRAVLSVSYTDEIRKPIEPELDGKVKNTGVDLAKQLITQISFLAKLATATLQPVTC